MNGARHTTAKVFPSVYPISSHNYRISRHRYRVRFFPQFFFRFSTSSVFRRSKLRSDLCRTRSALSTQTRTYGLQIAIGWLRFTARFWSFDGNYAIRQIAACVKCSIYSLFGFDHMRACPVCCSAHTPICLKRNDATRNGNRNTNRSPIQLIIITLLLLFFSFFDFTLFDIFIWRCESREQNRVQ